MSKIDVNGVNVNVIKVDNEDYISLTDMMRSKDGEFFFHNWLRNRNTVEFLGVWEKVNNPNFNYVEFDRIKIGIVHFLPNAKKLNSITVAQPVMKEELTIFGFHHISQADIVFIFDLDDCDRCVLYYDCACHNYELILCYYFGGKDTTFFANYKKKCAFSVEFRYFCLSCGKI